MVLKSASAKYTGLYSIMILKLQLRGTYVGLRLGAWLKGYHDKIDYVLHSN